MEEGREPPTDEGSLRSGLWIGGRNRLLACWEIERGELRKPKSTDIGKTLPRVKITNEDRGGGGAEFD